MTTNPVFDDVYATVGNLFIVGEHRFRLPCPEEVRAACRALSEKHGACVQLIAINRRSTTETPAWEYVVRTQQDPTQPYLLISFQMNRYFLHVAEVVPADRIAA